MPINESEWASIAAMIERVVQRNTPRHFITGRVIKSDPLNGLVWIRELGDQGIPVVGFGGAVKYYDEVVDTITSTLAANPTVTNRALTRQIFTSGSGTYNRPANCIALMAELVGGGGGGGSAGATGTINMAKGAGGSGGSYAMKLISSPAASYAYVVGAGGAAGLGSTNGDGSVGGQTSFGSTLVIAKGGTGGLGIGANSTAPSWVAGDTAPPSGSVGDLTIEGSPGEGALYLTTSNNNVTARGGDAARGGKGGRGILFAGAGGTSTGAAGSAPGGGGGGGGNGTSRAATNGSPGANGIIVVTEFYSIDVAIAMSGGISASTKMNVKHANAVYDVPKVGDSVVVALEMGEQSLPRCLGVIQGRKWLTPEDEGR